MYKCTNSVVIKNKNFTKFEPQYFFGLKNFENLFADLERIGLFASKIICCLLKLTNYTPFIRQKTNRYQNGRLGSNGLMRRRASFEYPIYAPMSKPMSYKFLIQRQILGDTSFFCIVCVKAALSAVRHYLELLSE